MKSIENIRNSIFNMQYRHYNYSV